MKKKLTIITALALATFLAAFAVHARLTPQEKYIAKYSAIAVNEMYRSGVPASITLAQGIVESASGQSVLATKGNNHFGIKCHRGWKGKTMKADDDRAGECFRVYDSAEDSFRDHSDFLRYRDRYKFLFDLETTDYAGWAHGLKKAGYATDPGYAGKLIKCIEDYDLARFDYMKVEETFEAGGTNAVKPETIVVEEIIPMSPNILELGVFPGDGPDEQYSFSISRNMYTCNGVPYVMSVEGDTYAAIAKENHLFLTELLHYNDLYREEQLQPGTRVYVQPKKKYSRKGLDKYIVDEDGEDIRSICQRFGVKVKSILKINGIPKDYALFEGDEILLRPAER